MPGLILTGDGSHTLATEGGVLYHSHHGAVQESRHIFIEAGLHEAARIFPGEELRVLEIGFGTGLNAFLTALECEVLQQAIHYTATELYPISEMLAATLNYPETPGHARLFGDLHKAPWETSAAITPRFGLHKSSVDISKEVPTGRYHLVYFDAFAPEDGPELWTEEVFRRVYQTMLPTAVLTTYCSKGMVRRAMRAAGFLVEKLPGPPGKREIVRARKPR